MKFNWFKVVVSLFAVAALAVVPVKAQITSGSVTGAVVDETGAVIPGATVRLTNQQTGVTREQETNQQGVFLFDRVSPGIYTVTISRQGFRTTEVTDLDVRIGKSTSIGRAVMEVGAAVETVTVTETAAPLMQSESAQISGNYSEEVVTETMLGTFGLDVLAILTPGVQPGFGNINSNSAFGSSGFGGQIGGDFAPGANGLRPRFTNFTIDGQDNNDVTISGPGYFVDMFDTVEEYQITTNQFNAEQGRNLGASINIVTKSGTNEHHGTVYWFHENAEKLNAVESDPAREGETVPPKFIENFLGFTWGGPFVQDKLFGFAAYQRIKDDFDQFDSNSAFSLDPAVPLGGDDQIAALGTNTAAILAGVGMNNPFGNPVCQTGKLLGEEAELIADGANSVDPSGTFAFFDLFVLDNQDLDDDGFLDILASASDVPFCSVLRTPRGNFLQDEFMTKLDWVGERNSAGGKYMWQDGTIGPFDLLFNGTGAVNVPFRSQFTNFYHTIQLSPRMLNEFRFSYQRLGVAFEGDPESSFFPTPNSFPRDDIFQNPTFIFSGTPWNILGQFPGLPQDRIVNTFQFTDNWSLVYGRHTLKAGIEVRRIRNSIFFLPTYNGLWVPVLGIGDHVAGLINDPDCTQFFVDCLPPRFFTPVGTMDELLSNNLITVFAFATGPFKNQPFETHQFYYFQDDFRVKPNLTLNLGIRYEHFGQPIDDITKKMIERERDPATAFWDTSLPLEDRTLPVIGSDNDNFAPRIGFAWTPRIWSSIFGEDATVIRGGYGLAYDVGFQNILLNTHTNAPNVLSQLRVLNPVNVIPGDGSAAAINNDPNLSPARGVFDPRLFSQTLVSGHLPGTNDLYNPYAQQWSLGIQREVRGTVAEVRYVGTRGIGLFQTRNANPTIATMFRDFPELVPEGIVPAANGRVFGDRADVFERCNCARSEYHGLQTRWDFRNLFEQVTGGVAWTWSKNIDNVSEVFDFQFEAGSIDVAPNPFDIIDAERGLSNIDLRNTFTWYWIWNLPFRRDQVGWLGKLAGGWEITGTGFIYSGRPWTAVIERQDMSSVCEEIDDEDGDNDCRPFLFNPAAPIDAVGFILPRGSGCTTRAGKPTPCESLHWILPDQNAVDFFGRPFGTSRNLNAGDGTVLVNVGIFKNTYANIGERRVNFQFRSQFVNLFNHRNFGTPPNSASDVTFTNEPEARSAGGRIIRFGMNIVF